ncbi:MAG TPA: biotin/lipoyl-binding protein [Burkholderiales bacterium]|jgi:putative peptide zinc metalloprotease protein
MSLTLYSSSWYRVATLKPRLRAHAQVHRHVYRGEIWYVLQDHSSGRYHRFTAVANTIIGLMDGRRTVQEIWDMAYLRLGQDVPPQDEVIKLMGDLHRADLLQSDVAPDLGEIGRRRQQHQTMRWKQYFGNPTALRFPLFDPDRLLTRAMPWLKPLFGWGGVFLWLLVVGSALALAGMHWRELSAGSLERIFSTGNLFLMWLTFPVVKLLHELGHAISVKARGGEVHEMGIMLLLLMPIPYVDASATSAMPERRWRALVGAAGMLTELFVAAIATVCWVYMEPGVPRAVAYNIILIAGVSTLVFNGNPLLRYDGYYILSDWLEIPNLAQRANEYVGYLVKRKLFGVRGLEAPHTAPGERGWFLFYAPASFAYRMFVMVTIVLMVSSQLYIIGVLLALWSLYTMLVMPLSRKIAELLTGAGLRAHRVRAVSVTAALAGGALALLFLLPFPSYTPSEGVIWVPPSSEVRAPVNGEVMALVARPNQPVHRGDVLLRLDDPELRARRAAAAALVDEMEERYAAATATNRMQAAIVQEQLVQARAALEVADKRLADLQVRSPGDGTFIIERAADVTGTYVQRGDLMAYVLQSVDSVRVVVSQAAESLVREQTTRVAIRAAERVSDVVQARITREVPAATDELPSMALSLQGGGKIGIDPSRPNDPRAIERLFVLDLALPPGTHFRHLGGRVYVRFEHPAEPLAAQWYRAARREFMRKFSA